MCRNRFKITDKRKPDFLYEIAGLMESLGYLAATFVDSPHEVRPETALVSGHVRYGLKRPGIYQGSEWPVSVISFCRSVEYVRVFDQSFAAYARNPKAFSQVLMDVS